MLSSAKLHISESRLMRKRSLIKILKSKGPRTDPCGTPILITLRYFYVNQFLPFEDGYPDNCTLSEGYLYLVHKLPILQ